MQSRHLIDDLSAGDGGGTRFSFYKQPGCLGVRPQFWPKLRQHAKQLEALNL